MATPLVDRLDDQELELLNRLLPWKCFTVDGHGRRFGDLAWAGKRGVPQAVPDPRIVRMHEAFDLRGKHVLEIGCFEGVHTAGLCRFAARVTAVDARIENVVKTVVRTAMFGCRPEVFPCDVENAEDLARLEEVDLVHHVGVLYHLVDPVAHLRRLAPLHSWSLAFSISGGCGLAPVKWTRLKGELLLKVDRAVVAQSRV